MVSVRLDLLRAFDWEMKQARCPQGQKTLPATTRCSPFEALREAMA
jgi:hypothetical protein